jgi:hypothetical protein
MTKMTALSRAAAVAAVLLAGGMTAAPTVAAPADVEFLQTYLGNWKGRGVLTGANTETVVCKLALTDANTGKVNYEGRCSLAGTTLQMQGTIAYTEANRRFEAAMTSNVGFSGTAAGRKQGNSIVFNINDKQKDEDGNDLQVTAAMVLANERINVDFKVVFLKTGDTIVAQVPFSK